MSEPMDKFRSLDGSDAVIEKPFIRVTFQHGHPNEVGINGCRVEDLIDVAVERLLEFQGRDLRCEENAEALEHLHLAREAMVRRRLRRLEQGVLNTQRTHRSTDSLPGRMATDVSGVAHLS